MKRNRPFVILAGILVLHFGGKWLVMRFWPSVFGTIPRVHDIDNPN